jgi:hypothetical protein
VRFDWPTIYRRARIALWAGCDLAQIGSARSRRKALAEQSDLRLIEVYAAATVFLLPGFLFAPPRAIAEPFVQRPCARIVVLDADHGPVQAARGSAARSQQSGVLPGRGLADPAA